MKECLHCKKEYEPKRGTSKFCSTNCRVKYRYHNGNKKNTVTPIQMQVLYNEILELAAKMKGDATQIRHINPLPTEAAVALHNDENKNQYTEVVACDYNGLKELISAATSATQLQNAWKIVEKANLPGWQMRQLTQLKELQRTKIDF